MKFNFMIAMAAAATIAAHASAAPLVRMESSHAGRDLPAGWTSAPGTDKSAKLELVFAVKQQRVAELEKKLLSVSDPDSREYGKHLSNDDVHSLVAPKQEHLSAVSDFLASHGLDVEPLTPNHDFLQVTVTVDKAEEILSCEYLKMTHEESGTEAYRTLAYHLPSPVSEAVDFVYPALHLPRVAKKITTLPRNAESPKFGNSPSHLRQLYSVDTVGKVDENKMAVTAFLDQHFHSTDLKEFWTLFCGGGLTCGKGDVITKGDGVSGLSAGVESMLDIESITGVAGNITAEFWGYSGKSPDNANNEPFMKWLTAMSNTSDADIPKIFSTSYGEDETSWSIEAATRMNTEFMKAGARGITLLYAAGDEGANCKEGKFTPETPGSSPWVTSVGGTTGSSTESAVGLSSGGFSARWPMPSYQKDAVSAYLATSKVKIPDAKKNGYDSSKRAYPDIAAQATDFTVVSDLIPMPGVAGTSCASPTAAGVIALLNDARLAAGKSTLGFMNPWLYKNAAAWNDITTGSSSGGACESGWPAVEGWDAVTGLGTPNYANLAKVL